MNYIMIYGLKSSDELRNLWGRVGIITRLFLVTEGLVIFVSQAHFLENTNHSISDEGDPISCLQDSF